MLSRTNVESAGPPAPSDVDTRLARLRGEIAFDSIMHDDSDIDAELPRSSSEDRSEPESVSGISVVRDSYSSFHSEILQSNRSYSSDNFFTAALSQARLRSTPDNLRQPWENGVLGSVFSAKKGSAAFPWLKDRVLNTSVPYPQMLLKSATSSDKGKQAIATTVPSLSSAVLRIKRPTLRVAPSSAEVLRSRAITKWRCIIESDLYKSEAGKQLIEYIFNGNCESLITQSIEDTFATKSTDTLVKRGQSIIAYLEFCRKQFGIYHISYKEAHVYAYLCNLRDSKASATKGTSFLQAMTFTLHSIKPFVDEDSWHSSRVKGVAAKMLRSKPPLNQSPPLFVWEVKLLHNILNNSDFTTDRVVAGYMLFLIYSCSRWSDGQFPQSVDNDTEEGFGYLEMRTTIHKTAQGARKGVLMPLVASSPGLGGVRDGKGWVDTWIEARISSGLEFNGDSPTMPSITADGSWSSSAMSSSQGSQYLRELVNSYAPKSLQRPKPLRSHSLKCTGLSWCAKRAVPQKFRKILGHHIDVGEVSVATYSRDYMYPALLAFDKVLSEIARGTFHPDESRAQRSRRLRSRLSTGEAAAPTEPEEAEVDADNRKSAPAPEEESSDSSDESEVTIPDADVDDVSMSVVRRGAEVIIATAKQTEFFWKANVPLTTYQHNSSGILHCASDVDFSKTACSRTISRAFTRINVGLSMDWPKCMVCSKKFGTKS